MLRVKLLELVKIFLKACCAYPDVDINLEADDKKVRK